MLPPVRSQDEFVNAHPVMKARITSQVGRAFPDDATRETMLRACMGLIKPCDDRMGGLFDHLERSGRNDATLIVGTSDHRHFMGDHGLGEKTLFQNAASRGPLIICNPSAEADATRGTV
ncbi:sulfatase-like hydrolase/transferase [Salipiger thiooxidans]|uniref:sulfatase-like hydrolase/transferase n=1 Tax=Salipiger thiooxidans TaxID=282683 RepID=UPI001CD2226F|nr:sulfatase-like hydrolase/transferase [Salipiger thiooxidans]MCA0849320.1 sulfatase-like hydrolase/transferase [Salipiger thiooxidans]